MFQSSQPVQLQAGQLTLRIEPRSGFVRAIHYRDVEVLRGIYAALRDHNWDTIEPAIRDWHLEEDEQGFRLSFIADCQRGDIDFTWHGRIVGSSDGRLEYTFDGVANSGFKSNRIGFCVLHTASCAGLACQVENVEGQKVEGQFPKRISPHQPFKDLRSITHEPITHEPMPGLLVEVRMEGATFETEDQRNWTDASYKTYCTPLELPFPVTVEAGDRVRQTITLKVEDRASQQAASRQAVSQQAVSQQAGVPNTRPHAEAIVIEIDTDSPAARVPEVGLGMASHGAPLTESQVALLQRLDPAHLRVDVAFDDANPLASFEQAAADAMRLGVPLEVALHLTDEADAELHSIAKLADSQEVAVTRWLIFHCQHKTTESKWISAARAILKPSFPDTPIVSGTNCYFAELNRSRPRMELLDALCYSINPQVHAFDSDSLVETLAAQAETVRSAHAFSSGKPIVISPVTLRPRFNPNATGPEPEPLPGELPTQVDPRQLTRFAAAWTLGSLKYLAESGAQSITYFETTGWRGVLECAEEPPLPERFSFTAGSVFPLYHVLADVNQFRGGHVVPCRSFAPLTAEALVLSSGKQRRILVANMTASETTVQFKTPDGRWSVRELEATSELQATTNPKTFRATSSRTIEARNGALQLVLTSHAIATLDRVE